MLEGEELLQQQTEGLPEGTAEPSAVAQPQNEPDVVKGAVAEAFAKFKAPEAKVSPEAVADPKTDAATTSDKARDAQGKFAAKAPAADEGAAQAAQDSAQQKAGKDGEPAATQPLTAPASWKAEAKAAFASLPPAVQADVVRREAELTKAIRQAQDESATTRKRYGELDEHLGAHRQRILMSGRTEAQAVRHLLDLEALAEQNPQAFIQEFARQRGIALNSLVQTAPQGAPNLNDLDPALVKLTSRMDMLEQERQAQLRQQQQAEYQANSTLVEAFEKETDESGAPLHPHFAELEKEIFVNVHLIKIAQPHLPPQQLLQQAYEQAVWANSSTREKLLASRSAQEAAARSQAVRTEATRAQTAAAATVRGRGPAPAPVKAKAGMNDIGSIIQETLQQHRTT